MANPSRAQLIERAKALGLKVEDDWTRKHIEKAIEIAEAEDDVQQEETESSLGEIGTPVDAEIPEVPTAEAEPTKSTAESEPIPPTAPAPPVAPPVAPPIVQPVAPPETPKRAAPQYNPNRPRIGAGRYHVLWTVTLPGGPVDKGIVNLNDAQAKSLVAQGAVVHVDDYEAYIKHNADKQPVAKRQTHPTSVPVGAGRYRTVGGVMRNGKEIPHGTVAEFSDSEVASLTKPGMIAIEYAD
jgi:hypothetical protein